MNICLFIFSSTESSISHFDKKTSKNIMVRHCVNAASTDLSTYNSKKQRDAADVVGR